MRATIIALLAATVSAGGIGKFFRAHVDAVDKARPRSAVIDVAVLKEARDAEAAVDAVSRSRGGEVAVRRGEVHLVPDRSDELKAGKARHTVS